MAKNRQSAFSKFYPLLGKLPLPVLYGFAYIIYLIGYYFFEKKRNVVASNLANSFPGKSPQEIKTLAALSFKRLTFVIFEAFKTSSLTEPEIRQRVIFKNSELIKEYAKNNQSVLLLAGHHCNWEWLLTACSVELAIPIDAVYKPLHDKVINQQMIASRSRFGAKPIESKKALFEIMKRRKEVRGFAMVADQSPMRKEEKYWTTFLNQDSSFAVGGQKIAQLTKYPAFFVGMRRLSLGHYEVYFEQIGSPPYQKEGYQLTEDYARALEKMIIDSPENWMWTNKKWKRKKSIYD